MPPACYLGQDTFEVIVRQDVVDGGGVERVINLELQDDELAGLRQSAEVLKSTLHQLKLQ